MGEPRTCCPLKEAGPLYCEGRGEARMETRRGKDRVIPFLLFHFRVPLILEPKSSNLGSSSKLDP